MNKKYRLYIDESGDHTYHSMDEPAKRFLGLLGLIIETGNYRTIFQPQFEALKQKHFPHNPDEPLILHRTDIINKRGLFKILQDHEKEKAFNNDFLHFLYTQDFTLILVVIDKKTHVERYGEAAFHPYHYCLAALLERFCGFLNIFKAKGDVMAESRGGFEDRKLVEAYRDIWHRGTLFRNPSFFQSVLTSKELKLKTKQSNIAGLQLADLLAHPLKQEILIENKLIEAEKSNFGIAICKCVQSKYNRHVLKYRVEGYGKVFIK